MVLLRIAQIYAKKYSIINDYERLVKMKKAKIICNPSSGRQLIQRRIDHLIISFVNVGYTVSKYNRQN